MVSRRFLRIKALKALYAHKCSDEDGVAIAQKKMLFSINKSYELYCLMMSLILEVSDYASNLIEVGRNKHLATELERNPNTKFIENRLIAKIGESEQLKDFLSKNNLSWNRDSSLIRSMYNSMVSSDYYKTYMDSSNRSFNDDKNFVLNFYRNEVEDCELLHTEVEEMSIYWTDDLEFMTSQLISSLNYVKEGDRVKLAPLFRNDDDKDFVRELFAQSIIHYDDNAEIIKKYSKNWELDRVTIMDRLIIIMAIVEFNSFPNIPVKVTMDEYLELSKYFSTRNSSVFINGILDRYIKSNEIEK